LVSLWVLLIYTKGSTKGNIKASIILKISHMEGNLKGDIKTQRELTGLTQEELSGKLKVNRKTVGEWESGESTPNKTSRRKLSNFFGVEFTAKGIAKPHINNNSIMKIQKDVPPEPEDKNWYKKTIDALIHINGEGIKEFRESKKEEIEELKRDKIRLHQHVGDLITKVNPPHNGQ
jgi:transcriptional regulator with XRE-family HTH domain